MDEAPEIPQPVPAIPRGPLWWSLTIPPMLTLFGSFLIGKFMRSESLGDSFLLVPLIVFFAIIIGLACFNGAVAKRYRGVSTVFLGWAYFLGQIIVCLALWLGSCLLYVS